MDVTDVNSMIIWYLSYSTPMPAYMMLSISEMVYYFMFQLQHKFH